MSNESAMDEKGFRRILNRNVGLPLGLGLVGALFFALLPEPQLPAPVLCCIVRKFRVLTKTR